MSKVLLKKMLLFCIIGTLLISTRGMNSVHAKQKFDLKNTNEFDIKVNYRSTLGYEKSKTVKDLVKDKFKIDSSLVCSDKTKMDLKIRNLSEIIIDGITPLEGEGSITIAGEKHSFKGEGQFYPTKTQDGTLVLEGKLKGYLDNTEDIKNYVIMALYYMPYDEKCLINATFGALGSTNEKVVHMSFGEATPSMNEVCKKEFMDTVKKNEDKKKLVGYESDVNKSEISSLLATQTETETKSKVDRGETIIQAKGGVKSGLFSWIAYPSRWHAFGSNFIVCAKASINQVMAYTYVMSVDSQAREYVKDWTQWKDRYGSSWCFLIESVTIDLRHNDAGVSLGEKKPETSSESYDIPINPWFWLPSYLKWIKPPIPKVTVTDIRFTNADQNRQLKWDFYRLYDNYQGLTLKTNAHASAQEMDKGLYVSATLSDSKNIVHVNEKYDVNFKAYISADTGIFTITKYGSYEKYHNTLSYELKGKPLQLKHTSYDLGQHLD